MSILIEPAGGSVIARLDLEADCSLATVVGDAVYITGSSSVAPAMADSKLTMPAIGIVVEKLTSTSCKVRRFGEATVFAGLVAGATYRVSELVPGAITLNPAPLPGILPIFVYQSMGFGVNGSTLAIDPDPSDRVIVY